MNGTKAYVRLDRTNGGEVGDGRQWRYLGCKRGVAWALGMLKGDRYSGSVADGTYEILDEPDDEKSIPVTFRNVPYEGYHGPNGHLNFLNAYGRAALQALIPNRGDVVTFWLARRDLRRPS